MTAPTTYRPTLRDKIAQRLANLALMIATPHYRAMVGGAIEYGLRAAARDTAQQRTPPGDWRDPDTRARWVHGEEYK